MIILKNVSKKYDDSFAVNGLNIEIHKGELCVLLGASGCGKSTVIKLINSLLKPDEGDIFFNGINITKYKEDELRRKIGYVIQSTGLFPHYTVYENISVVPKLLKWTKIEIDKKVDEMLELVGIDKTYKAKFPHELSGGEGQRVGVARALAGNPEVLLLDEPFGSVDPLNRERLQNEFLKIQKTLKKTVLFVTHDVQEAVKMADRILLMKEGKLLKSASPIDFLQDGQNSYIDEFLGVDFALKLLSRYTVSDCLLEENIENIENSENNCKENFDVTTEKNSLVTSSIEILSINVSPYDTFNVSPYDTLNQVLSKMITNGLTQVVVLDGDGKTKGVLTIRSLVDTVRGAKA